jgi:hypothetical protein
MFLRILFQKKNPAEYNYEIYNKEILVIIKYLREYNKNLKSIKYFQIYMDYKNLEYFMIIH